MNYLSLNCLIFISFLGTETFGCLPNFNPFVQFRPFSCEVLKRFRNVPSGFYYIYPFACCPDKPVLAYCDQSTNGGGWTVILKRDAATTRVNFYRNWTQYENGFGTQDEYWLGLKAIHELTTRNKTMLRVELVSQTGQVAYPEYRVFQVAGPSQKYGLTVSDFSGTGGDSLIDTHNGEMFSTFDQDFDKSSSLNCADKSKGGWWYNNCHESNLNGFQYVGEVPNGQDDGIMWKSWENFESHSMAKVKMMIKPNDVFF